MPYKKTKEGRLVNEVTLGDGYPLSNDLQPLKIGGEASILGISSPLPDGSDSGLFRVDGDLDITGTLKTKLSHDLIYDFDDEVNTLAQAKVDALIDSAPGALDTLNELAAALGDDASFATTVTNSLALKAPLAAPAFTGNATFDSTTLAIDATNNRVGIGVTDPDSRLEIVGEGNDNSTTSFYVKNSDNTNLFYVRDDGVVSILGGYLFAQHSNGAYFTGSIKARGGVTDDGGTLGLGGGGNLDHLNILSGGNVGIGNTSPNHLLHVGDDVTASFGTAPDKAIQLSSSTNDHEIAYILYAGEGTNNIRSKYFIDDATKYVGWDIGWSTGALGYQWLVNNVEKMKLNTDGNLTLSGTVDGRDIATDGSKLDGIESNATADQTAVEIIGLLNSDLGGNFTIGTQSDDTATLNGNLMLRQEGGIFVENLGSPTGSSTGFGGSILIPPKGMYRVSNSSITGAIKIHIPRGTGDATDWISMWVDVSDYATDESFSAYIQGYMYKNEPGSESTASEDHEWVSETAMIFAKKQDRDFTVSYGHDDTDWFVAIGAVDSTWSYPQVTVRDVQIGGGSDIDDYTDDWDITFVTDFGTTVHQAHTDNFPVVKGTNITELGTITTGTWNGGVIASAYLDSDTAHLSGNQTFTGVKTFSSAVTIHTATDAILNFKSSDDSWSYMQFLQNDGDRIAYIGTDGDQDRLIINATENGANEIDINTTTLDINANVKISGTLDMEDSNITDVGDIALDTISSDAGTSINVTLGTDAGDDFIVDTDTLVVEGDNNRVGIGTTSPAELLHVASETDPTLVLQCPTNNQTNSGTISFRESGTTEQMAIKYNGSTNNLIIDTADVSNAFVLQRADGHIGINTDSPTTTLDVEGSVSYKHISLTADSDDLDVSGCTVVEATPSGTDRLGGLTGGVQGQVLYVLKVDSGLGRLIIEHNEGTGNQDIFTSSGSDVMLSTRGGMTLYCNGTSWFALDK